ncbi:MAG: hypothetical protein HYT79_07520 [Elusimicrobia bacterium]|nr:hypothetical protein [Elusimicrobiota bacterium]
MNAGRLLLWAAVIVTPVSIFGNPADSSGGATIHWLDASSRTACLILPQRDLLIDTADNPAAEHLWVYLHLPRKFNADTPFVIVLPILGGSDLWIENRFAAALTRRGLAAGILILPQQFNRRYFLSLPSGKLFLDRNPERLANNFKQSLKDIQTLITALQQGLALGGAGAGDGRWKPKKFGILGTSLGGIVGSVAMSRDERLQAGAFLLAGSDPASILTEGDETRRVAKKLGATRSTLAGLLEDFDLNGLTARKNPGGIWKGRPILLIHAIWDGVIPRPARRALDEAIPHAQITHIPAGHVSAIVYIGWIKNKVAKFFEENLQ